MNDTHRRYESTEGGTQRVHRAHSRPRVGVVGGGVAGLTAAHHLNRRGVEAHVFEASREAGGCLNSTEKRGYVLERGPHTLMTGNLAVDNLLSELGLDDVRQPAPAAAKKRYIVKRGRLLPLPDSLSAFLNTRLFSPRAKLRLLAEPFIGAGATDRDESLAQFIERRLGEEFLDYAVGPFVAGIYAADPRLLSSEHAIGALHEMEQNWGSLFLGAAARGLNGLLEGGPSASGELIGLDGGNQRLADRLSERLGNRLHLNARITAIHRRNDGWSVRTTDGQWAGPFDDLILTAPAHCWPEIDVADAQLADELDDLADTIDYPPVAVVSIAVDRNRVYHPLDGFGMLVPTTEAYRMLGTLFISTLFPERTPPGKVLLSTFVGGSRDRSLAKLTDEQLVDTVETDLSELIGIKESPDFVDVYRWPRAIPQYEVGYGRLLDKMDALERNHPGFHLLGNFRNGIGVPDVIEGATELAQELARLHADRAMPRDHIDSATTG